MGKADVDAVCKNMRLANGVVWSIPIVFDLSGKEVADYGVKRAKRVLLTFGGNPMAIMEIEEIYEYERTRWPNLCMARMIRNIRDALALFSTKTNS